MISEFPLEKKRWKNSWEISQDEKFKTWLWRILGWLDLKINDSRLPGILRLDFNTSDNWSLDELGHDWCSQPTQEYNFIKTSSFKTDNLLRALANWHWLIRLRGSRIESIDQANFWSSSIFYETETDVVAETTSRRRRRRFSPTTEKWNPSSKQKKLNGGVQQKFNWREE